MFNIIHKKKKSFSFVSGQIIEWQNENHFSWEFDTTLKVRQSNIIHSSIIISKWINRVVWLKPNSHYFFSFIRCKLRKQLLSLFEKPAAFSSMFFTSICVARRMILGRKPFIEIQWQKLKLWVEAKSVKAGQNCLLEMLQHKMVLVWSLALPCQQTSLLLHWLTIIKVNMKIWHIWRA